MHRLRCRFYHNVCMHALANYYIHYGSHVMFNTSRPHLATKTSDILIVRAFQHALSPNGLLLERWQMSCCPCSSLGYNVKSSNGYLFLNVARWPDIIQQQTIYCMFPTICMLFNQSWWGWILDLVLSINRRRMEVWFGSSGRKNHATMLRPLACIYIEVRRNRKQRWCGWLDQVEPPSTAGHGIILLSNNVIGV